MSFFMISIELISMVGFQAACKADNAGCLKLRLQTIQNPFSTLLVFRLSNHAVGKQAV